MTAELVEIVWNEEKKEFVRENGEKVSATPISQLKVIIRRVADLKRTIQQFAEEYDQERIGYEVKEVAHRDGQCECERINAYVFRLYRISEVRK